MDRWKHVSGIRRTVLGRLSKKAGDSSHAHDHEVVRRTAYEPEEAPGLFGDHTLSTREQEQGIIGMAIRQRFSGLDAAKQKAILTVEECMDDPFATHSAKQMAVRNVIAMETANQRDELAERDNPSDEDSRVVIYIPAADEDQHNRELAKIGHNTNTNCRECGKIAYDGDLCSVCDLMGC